MPVEDVESAIKIAKKVIEKHGSSALSNEANTRYFLIDPILRSLGWQLENPEHCKFEVLRTVEKQKRTDYVLYGDKGTKSLAAIEAKGWTQTKLNGFTEEDQLKGWALGSDVKLAVLTNGQSWYFYVLGSNSPFGEKRGPDVNICEDDVSIAAKMLNKSLSRHNALRWK